MVVYVFISRKKKPVVSLPMYHTKAYTDVSSTPVTMVPKCAQQVWVPWKAHAE